jgi:hypothetical protein
MSYILPAVDHSNSSRPSIAQRLALYDAFLTSSSFTFPPTGPAQVLANVRSSCLRARDRLSRSDISPPARLVHEYDRNFKKIRSVRSSYNNAIASCGLPLPVFTFGGSVQLQFSVSILHQSFPGLSPVVTTAQGPSLTLAEDAAMSLLIDQLRASNPPLHPAPDLPVSPNPPSPSQFDAILDSALSLSADPLAPSQALHNLRSALIVYRSSLAPPPVDDLPHRFLQTYNLLLPHSANQAEAYVRASSVHSLPPPLYVPVFHSTTTTVALVQVFGVSHIAALGSGPNTQQAEAAARNSLLTSLSSSTQFSVTSGSAYPSSPYASSHSSSLI